MVTCIGVGSPDLLATMQKRDATEVRSIGQKQPTQSQTQGWTQQVCCYGLVLRWGGPAPFTRSPRKKDALV